MDANYLAFILAVVVVCSIAIVWELFLRQDDDDNNDDDNDDDRYRPDGMPTLKFALARVHRA